MIRQLLVCLKPACAIIHELHGTKVDGQQDVELLLLAVLQVHALQVALLLPLHLLL